MVNMLVMDELGPQAQSQQNAAGWGEARINQLSLLDIVRIDEGITQRGQA